jgi:hypothetical protein
VFRADFYGLRHSTESAIVSVYSDMIEKSHMGALVLFDVASAFDIVNPSILVEILQRRFRAQGLAVEWFNNFVTDHIESVIVANTASAATAITCEVLHMSVFDLKS